MRYLSAFNSKTLHDGSNRFSVSKLEVNLEADVEQIKMANGALFDPAYGEGTPQTPLPFTATHFFKFSTDAAAEAEITALEDLIGSNGTATASLDSGGSDLTCNASLKSVKITPRKNKTVFLASFYFVPFDYWS